MADTFQRLNPQTPLAFVPPEDGNQFKTSVYVIIASQGAFLWDVIANAHSDYRLLFEHRLSFPTFVYFLSRFTVLTSNTVNIITQTAPLGLALCKNFMTTTCVLYHIAFSSTTLLWFLRVRAIFNHNKYIVAFFLFLWLGVVGGTVTLAIASGAITLEPTDYCLSLPMKPFIAASPITLAVMDTCIFLAISWRLLSISLALDGRSTPSVLKHFMLGRDLPSLTKALLQDGQIYYLISTLSNILALILITLPAVPAGYRFMYVFNCSITNMMACRVYRHTKFGDFQEDSISTTFILAQARGEMQDGSSPPSTTSKSSGNKNKEGAEAAVPVYTTRQRLERMRSKFLLAVTVFVLIFVPVLCVSLCMSRRHKQSMRQ